MKNFREFTVEKRARLTRVAAFHSVIQYFNFDANETVLYGDDWTTDEETSLTRTCRFSKSVRAISDPPNVLTRFRSRFRDQCSRDSTENKGIFL